MIPCSKCYLECLILNTLFSTELLRNSLVIYIYVTPRGNREQQNIINIYLMVTALIFYTKIH